MRSRWLWCNQFKVQGSKFKVQSSRSSKFTVKRRVDSSRVKRILLLATTTGYQTRMFGEAAERLGVKLLFATDRCDQLDDPWWDSAIPIRFHQEAASVDAIMRAVDDAPPDGVVAVGDRATTIAAFVATLLGLPGHPPEAAAAARDKRLTRERLQAAGLPAPWYQTLPVDVDPITYASKVPFPAVVKPLSLSGSRGVMRADTPADFVAAFERLQRLLHATDVRVMQDAANDAIQVESFIEGREYAVEALLHHGALQTLALFDKPEPLDGPFFEETIYVTPSRVSAPVQQEIRHAVADAARALGLYHGPVHAECRVNARGVFVLEVAARAIGGLCARALEFEGPCGARVGGRRVAASARARRVPGTVDSRARRLRRDDDSDPPCRRLSTDRRRGRGEARPRRVACADDRKSRPTARAVAGRRELPGIHLCERRVAGDGGGGAARSARAPDVRD
jgi:hypothetical protein